jgi:hypothetical protein
VDHVEHTIEVAQDVVVPEPLDVKSTLPKPMVPSTIVRRIRMLTAIHLDHEAMREGKKIGYVWPHRRLPPKFPSSKRRLPQGSP